MNLVIFLSSQLTNKIIQRHNKLPVLVFVLMFRVQYGWL